jgi:MFS family permease
MQATGETYPRTAYLLSLIGGILILLFSILTAVVLLAIASFFAAVGFGLGVGFAVAAAVIALLFGLIILYFAIKLKSNPGSAKTYGILIIVFALISFIGGGGLYIGAILALVGGILALVWTPPAQPVGYGQPPMQAAPGWGQPTMAAAPPAGAGGGKFCASCGSPNAPGAQFCAKCGAPMPP